MQHRLQLFNQQTCIYRPYMITGYNTFTLRPNSVTNF